MNLRLLTATLCFPVSLAWAPIQAAPLKSATVTEKYNQVTLRKEGAEERQAAIKDVMAGKDILSTGKKSRVELEFPDKSLARLGSNTVFSFEPTSREMNLQRGTALIHVPPGLSGARISSPAATAAILGDVVAMRVNEKGVTQIVALSKDESGPVTVTLNKTGEKRTLGIGEMLTIDPLDVRIPEPLVVAVDVFVQTSGLVNRFEKKLPETAQSEVQRGARLQQEEVRSGELDSPALVTNDCGTLQQLTTGGDAMNVQSTSSSRFAGFGSGRTFQGPGCPAPGTVTGSFTFTISPDGVVTGSGVDGGIAYNFTSQVNNDGTFDGGNVKGTYTDTTFLGTVSTPEDPLCKVKDISGTFQGK